MARGGKVEFGNMRGEGSVCAAMYFFKSGGGGGGKCLSCPLNETLDNTRNMVPSHSHGDSHCKHLLVFLLARVIWDHLQRYMYQT